MKQTSLCPLITALLVLLLALPSAAQVASRAPHLGYAFPAGAQVGTKVQITLGGQYLNGAEQVYVSGTGVHAAIAKYKRPMNGREVNLLRDKLQKAREKALAELRQRNRNRQGKAGRRNAGLRELVAKYAIEMGATREQLEDYEEFRRQKSDPKRQLNPQLAERLFVDVTIDPDAAAGRREIRVRTSRGMTNPIWFDVGAFVEHTETEPNGETLATDIRTPSPFVLNGQILPGDVDRFEFRAQRGQKLVIAASARDLIPYLADAVPGWFQATLTLYDEDGKELAYDDDFEFHPDPVLFYQIPKTGTYVLEIRDAIYRGREDFVYRITVGELPFVTSIFPLGCQAGQHAVFTLRGWNLTQHQFVFDASDQETGVRRLFIPEQQHGFNQVKIAVNALPDQFEQEPNDRVSEAQQLTPPLIVNGRIDRPGDCDVFKFMGREGGLVILDIQARRLNSPVDSLVRLTDENGTVIGVNDDTDDKGDGLTTHHADSHLLVTLPHDGPYFVHVTDTQDHGGPEYAYRLRISARQPDFRLRVVPSSVNARPGETVPIIVYALRKDGFDGDITLALRRPSLGLTLSGNWIPAGQDHVQMTVTIPRTAPARPVRLELVGRARIAGRTVFHTAVPAEDMVQAFVNHHLVPVSEFVVDITGKARYPVLAKRRARRNTAQPALRSFGHTPVKLPLGQSTRLLLLAKAPAAARQIQMALAQEIEGISIKKVQTEQDGIALQIKTDPKKVEPGLKGNLIVNLFVQRTARNRKSAKSKTTKRRVPVGTLPAIPFEVVQR